MQRVAATDPKVSTSGVCIPDAACILLECKPENRQIQCSRYSEIADLRKKLKDSGHTIGETYIRCEKCKGINGHTGFCENRFGVRINTLSGRPSPKLGECPATSVQRSLPVEECTEKAFRGCSFFKS